MSGLYYRSCCWVRVLTCCVHCNRRVTNRLSARRMRQKRAEEREAVAKEVMLSMSQCLISAS